MVSFSFNALDFLTVYCTPDFNSGFDHWRSCPFLYSKPPQKFLILISKLYFVLHAAESAGRQEPGDAEDSADTPDSITPRVKNEALGRKETTFYQLILLMSCVT